MSRYNILKILKDKYKENIYKTGVYKISFKDSKHLYIGIATRVNKFNCYSGFYNRWKRHLIDLEKNKHNNRFIQRLFNKEGLNNIKFEIVELVEKEECENKEIEYFKKLKPDLNFILNKRKPYRHFYTDEERKRRSKIMEGRTHTEETKKIIGEGSKGNKHAVKIVTINELNKAKENIFNGKSNIKREYIKIGICRETFIKNYKQHFNYKKLLEASNKFNSLKKIDRNNKRKGKLLSYNVNTINKILTLYREGNYIKEIRKEVNLNEDLIGKLIRENMNKVELKKIKSKNAIRK